MLTPEDIAPSVLDVLLNAETSLCVYQILDRLPTALRAQIIGERGFPRAGVGNSYSAAALVTEATERLLPSTEPPFRVNVNVSALNLRVAGNTVEPETQNIPFYRMTPPVAVPSAAAPTAGTIDPLMFKTHVKAPWYDKGTMLILWMFVFWPVALYGYYRSSLISPKAKKVMTWCWGVYFGLGMIYILIHPIKPSIDGAQTTVASTEASTPDATPTPESDNTPSVSGNAGDVIHLGEDWPFSEESGMLIRATANGNDHMLLFLSGESFQMIALNGMARAQGKSDPSLGYVSPYDCGIWLPEGNHKKSLSPLFDIANRLEPGQRQPVAR